MGCDSMREAISAYVDAELDEPRQREVAAHIADCRECRQAVEDLRQLRLQIAEGARVTAPAGLSHRVRAALAREALDEAAPRRRAGVLGFAWRQAAAVLFICTASGAVGWLGGARMAASDRIERDLVASHMRALIQDSPIQVASSNIHNVKPWFAGRVEFSPSVKDLSAAGFELVGGRLDYIGDRRVGVVVYKHRQHWIDVYAWPSSAAVFPIQSSARGYNLVRWTQDGLVYWAVSDLNREELVRLKDLL